MAARDPVIVGIGLSDYPVAPHLSSAQHHAQAMQRALADSGVAKDAVDGFLCAGMASSADAVMLAEYLGIQHRYIDSTMTGGSSFEFHVQHASAAIRQGLCDTALVSYGSDYLSRLGRTLGTRGMTGGSRRVSGTPGWEAPYGLSIVGCYAMVAQRHIYEFGTKPEQLAQISVGVREFAGLNPLAMYRDPISVDDVLGSRMIADPLHKLECCVVSDGGGALIVTTEERARDLPQPAVRVLGASGAQTHWNISQMGDFTHSAAVRCAPEAFTQAGVTPADIDTIQFYDSFTITVLMLLEDCGFCAKGEGGAFVAEGHLARGGRLPLNTDGGGLSSSHSGMRGIFLLIEATRQLRGQGGDAQVPDCALALCAGSGGFLSCIGTVILGRE